MRRLVGARHAAGSHKPTKEGSMNAARAIIISASIIAVSLVIAALLGDRYEMAEGGRAGLVVRLDTLTGTIKLCVPTLNGPGPLRCHQWE